MRSVGNVVSRFRVFPHSNLQSSPEQRRLKRCPSGFLNPWAGRGGRSLSLHRWRGTETTSDLFSLPLIQSKKMKDMLRSSWRSLWRAELVQDMPFAIAIGACILSSFALVQENADEMKRSEGSVENSDLDTDDMRYGVMTIISFIPLFNWLGWVFAWLDTNEKRYLFYAIVYLAPYLRTSFSLSPDDSWLPITSLIACMLHVQLEINLNTGAELGNEFLRDAVKQIYPKVRIPELWGQGKGFAETPPPEPNDEQYMTEEAFGHQELLEFDKKLASLENISEKKEVEKIDQMEADKNSFNAEKADD